MDEHLNQDKKGRLFAGRYLLEECIGEGGMGVVYLAKDTMLNGEEIAVKFLHKDLTSDEKHSRRFLREVQLARKVTHDNVVRIYDAGKYEDRFYITMEYARGVTLSEKIKEGPIDADVWFEVLLSICDGLQAVHNVGIIHRDIKPGNIILTVDGSIKIADFGVARPETSSLTKHNEIVGSAAYLAPEAWSGVNVGMAADIYSLGVVSYEMLAGQLPFTAGSPAEMMCKHLEEPYIPVRNHCSIIPELEEILDQMLEKDPKDRFESSRKLKEAILGAEEKAKKNNRLRSGKTAKASFLTKLLSEPEPEPQILGANEQLLPRDRNSVERSISSSKSFDSADFNLTPPLGARIFSYCRKLLTAAVCTVSIWMLLNHALSPFVKSLKTSTAGSLNSTVLVGITVLNLFLVSAYVLLPLFCLSVFAPSFRHSARAVLKSIFFSVPAVLTLFFFNFYMLQDSWSSMEHSSVITEEHTESVVKGFLLSALPATAYTSLHAAALSPEGAVFKTRVSYGSPELIKLKPDRAVSLYSGVVLGYLFFMLFLVYSELWPSRSFKGFVLLAAVPACALWAGCTFVELPLDSWAWLKLGAHMGVVDFDLRLIDLAGLIGTAAYLSLVSVLLPFRPN